MTKYLLPCQCGKSLQVEPTQAGQDIQCECGATVVAPAMRKIKELKPAADTADPRRKRGGWNEMAATVLAIGMLLTFGGGVSATICYMQSVVHYVPVPSEETIAAWGDAVDNMTLNESMQAWEALNELGLPPYDDSPYTRSRRDVGFFNRIALYSLACAALGLILAGSSVAVWGRPQSHR